MTVERRPRSRRAESPACQLACHCQCRALVARPDGRHRDHRHQRGLDHVCRALCAVAPRGGARRRRARVYAALRTTGHRSVVLLDASGLSRLFGSAQELGEHLRDALIETQSDLGDTRSACGDCVDANRGDAISARQSWPHGGDARQRSDRAGAAQRQRSRSIRAAFRISANRPKPQARTSQAPPTQEVGTIRDRLIRRAERNGELPRIGCWRF